MFVCGNIAALGDWNAEWALPLRWNGEVHEGTIEAEIGSSLEYKILRGGWPSEAVDAWGNVPPNARHEVWLDATVHRTVADWKDRYDGRLMRDRTYSRSLASWRELLVWLPSSYAAEPDRRYPVLYFNDGANVFDPQTSPLSGVDLAADEWVRLLAAEGGMPETIIVGVCHPEGLAEEYLSLREVDLSDELGGIAYSEFLARELVPEIDARYRTQARATARMLGGTGLGALNALATAIRQPGVFGKIACLSTSFGEPPGSCGELEALAGASDLDREMRWYFDYGSVPPDDRLESRHRELATILIGKGWREGRGFRVLRVIGAPHDERSWRLRLGDALRFLWRDWKRTS